MGAAMELRARGGRGAQIRMLVISRPVMSAA